jgi:hypothetical protein
MPNPNRPSKEPGGCECENCGRIFIGGPTDTICGVCWNDIQRSEAQRTEFHEAMRRDVFGE